MMPRPRAFALASLFATTLFAAAGCKHESQDPAASQAVDSADVAQSEAAIVVAATDSAGPGAKASDVAEAAVGSATKAYAPASCVTAKLVDAATVLYSLHDCTGPYHLVHVTGDVTVVFSDEADGLHAHATAKGLDINGASIDVDADGLYTVSGTTKTLDVTTNGQGVGPRGTHITRHGEYTATWDSADTCFGLDGDWSTTVGFFAWDTKVRGYDRCANQCPAAGGSITWTGKKSEKSLTVSFDGSDVAKWSTSTGKSGTVDLLCGG